MRIRLLVLCAFSAAAVSAQSVSITSPTSGATWTGWTGQQFAVALSAAPSVVRVCYSVDAYPATNAGADVLAISGTAGALYAAGCSNGAPFSFPVNTFWWADGTAHTVYATAYDSLGNVVAVSPPRSFAIANTWPVSCGGSAPQYAMTTSGATGQVTVTGTVTGACASDSLSLNVYLNGLLRATGTMSGGTLSIPIDTTQVDNGSAVIATTVIDSTNAPSGVLGAAGEASKIVTLSNGAVPMEVRVTSNATGYGGRTLYGGPGGSVVITPHLVMTDESDGTAAFLSGGGTFYYASSNTAVATVSASSGSSVTVNYVAQGAAKIWVMAGQKTLRDVVPNFASNEYWNSATLGSFPDYANRMIYVTGSAQCVGGAYTIGETGPSALYYAANDLNGVYLGPPGFFVSTSSTGPCTGYTGPTRTLWAQVNTSGNPAPPIAHFTNTGQVTSTYTPGSSVFVNSLFQGTTEDGSQIYPTPIQTSICQSGFNTVENGMPGEGSTAWGSYTQSALLAQFESELESAKAIAGGGGCNPYLWLTGANMIRGLATLYAATQGPTSGRNGSTWTSGATGISTVFQAINAVNAMGGSQAVGMEANDEFGYNATALGGPIILGGASNGQNWLGSSASITCTSSTCTVTTSAGTPGGYQIWMGESPFGIIISGSAQGFNTPTGGPCPIVTGISATSFSFPKPSGVTAGTYNSTNDPNLRIWMQSACQWYTPPGGSSATDWTWDDSMGWLRAQINTVSGHIAYVPSLAASEGGLFDACLNGNTIYCQQSQTYASIGQTINIIGDGDNRYWTHDQSCESYLVSRMQTMGYIYDPNPTCTSLEEVPVLRRLYGYYDPAKPLQTISQGTSTNWNFQPAQGISVVSCTGNTVTLSASPHLDNFLPGAARLWITGSSDPNCNTKMYLLSAPTPTTLKVALAATTQTFTSQGNNSGTIHFQNGDTFPLYGVNAGGPNDCGTGQPCPIQWGNNTLDYSTTTACAATGNTSFLRHRGQTFTLTGVTGAGASYFNSLTGIYDIENLPVPTDSNGSTSSCKNYWREIPNFSGTGGTAYVIGDNGFIPGRNPFTVLSPGNTTPDGTFLSVVGCLLARCSSHRLYQLYRNPNAYNPEATMGAGFPQYKAAFMNYVGPGSYTGFSWNDTDTINQMYSHPNVENGYSVPEFHAGSEASRMASRLACYFLGGVALDAVDYGVFWESASVQGSCGYLHIVANYSGATETRTVTLTPYETSGQNIILWVADATHGIEPLAIVNAGTATYSLTLLPGQAAWFAFPKAFAGVLNLPTVGFRLADVSNATSIAARCAYDEYLLPNAVPMNLGAGTGGFVTAALNMDRNLGPLYCTFSYLGSSNQLLAGGEVKTF